jgi:rhomboid protease GluP
MAFLLDPNELLWTLVLVWSGASALQVLLRLRLAGRRREVMDIGFAVAVVLFLGGGVRLVAPAMAGYCAGLAWLAVVAFPLFAGRLTAARAARRDFATAERIALVVTWLRPFGGWEDAPPFYQAQRALARGDEESARTILTGIEARGGALATLATAEKLLLNADWRAFREFAESTARDAEIPSVLLTRYLRALGETGELDRLLEVAEHHLDRLWRSPAELQHAVLFAFAFSGRRRELGELLEGPLRHLDQVSKEAWMGTAELAAGDNESGLARLRRCRPFADAAQIVSLERRIFTPPRSAREQLSALGASRLRRLIEVWEKAQRYLPGNAAPRAPVGVFALIATILAAFFAEEALGGSTQQEVLIRLGAMVPELVLQGEWWRVFTAQFLHLGPVHLVANLSGLLLVGGYVERRLGLGPMLLTYFASGTVPMLMHVALAGLTRGADADVGSIGASGCLMGLVGATAAILARGWFEDAVRPAGRPLFSVVAMIVFQALLDIAVPIVDFLGHSLGAVVGFTVAGVLFGMRAWRIVLVALPGTAIALGVTVLADELPWRAAPCSSGEVHFCKELCDLGMLDACFSLGLKYAEGTEVQPDAVKARRLLERACSGDVTGACEFLEIWVDRSRESPRQWSPPRTP